MENKQGVVCFIIENGRVLLALIEYEPGDKKWNGIGGVIEPDESPRRAVAREISEETELVVAEQDLIEHGVIQSGKLPLHIFTTSKWSGELIMKDPTLKAMKWFDFTEVPYAEMWPGNDQWLPFALAGKPI